MDFSVVHEVVDRSVVDLNDTTQCLNALLSNGTHFLSTHAQIHESIFGIQQNVNDFQERSGISERELQWFIRTVLPCALNVTQMDYITGVPINATLHNIQTHCLPGFCNDTGLHHLDTCLDADLDAFVFWFMGFLSIFITFVMSFVQKRKRFGLNCCFQRPGPIVPLNMLDSYENRKGFALSFGVVATYCLMVLFSDYNRIFFSDIGNLIKELPSYLSVFIKFLCGMMISQVAYPFFICQNMENQLVGSILGFLLCSLWLSLEILKLVVKASSCWLKWEYDGIGANSGVIQTLGYFPLYISLLFLAAKFAYTFAKTLKLRAEKRKKGQVVNWLHAVDTDWKKEFIYLYVKRLFRREEENLQINFDEKKILKVKNKILSLLYVPNPDFKYSTRMVSSLLVAVFAIYIASTLLIWYGYVVFIELRKYIFSIDTLEFIARTLNMKMHHVKYYVEALVTSWWIAAALGTFGSFIVILSSLSWYRHHCVKLRQGNRSFLPVSVRRKLDSPGSLMTASLKFAGYQVGYAAWGFLNMSLVIFLLSFIFITQIIFAFKFSKKTILVRILEGLWPTFATGVILLVLQRLISSFCFLIDSETLAVNNRRAFHIISYYMFFFNMFLGLISCLLRIAYGILYGMVFIQRLQRSTLPRQFEERDPGYMAYLGYLLLEHQHANVVLQCFCRLLLEESDALKSGLKYVSVAQGEELFDLHSLHLKKRRVENRWHLYVLLIRNPSLRMYRVHNLRKRRLKHVTRALSQLNGNFLDRQKSTISIFSELNYTSKKDKENESKDSEEQTSLNKKTSSQMQLFDEASTQL